MNPDQSFGEHSFGDHDHDQDPGRPDAGGRPAAGDPVDLLVRQVPLVTDAQADLGRDDAWFGRLAARVVDGDPGHAAPSGAGAPARPHPSPARRSRLPRWVVLGGVSLGAVGLGAGAAVSVTEFLQPDRLSVVCVLGEGQDSEQVTKRATVADPVAACRREWPSAAGTPELGVFMDRFGSVYVAPVDWDSGRQGAERVSAAVAFDPRPARLQASLDDWIDGLPSDCLSTEEAVARVEEDLARLGLVAWSVGYEDDDGREVPADGVRTCATWAFVADEDSSQRRVVVRGVDPEVATSRPRLAMDEAELRDSYTREYRDAVASGAEFEDTEQEWVQDSIDIDASVRSQLQGLREAFGPDRCLTVTEAEREVVGILDPAWNPVVDVAVDDALPCAVVEVGMGGTWLVSIVGPQATED